MARAHAGHARRHRQREPGQRGGGIISKADLKAYQAKKKGAEWEAGWNQKFEHYAKAFPAEAAEFKRRMAGERGM